MCVLPGRDSTLNTCPQAPSQTSLEICASYKTCSGGDPVVLAMQHCTVPLRIVTLATTFHARILQCCAKHALSNQQTFPAIRPLSHPFPRVTAHIVHNPPSQLCLNSTPPPPTSPLPSLPILDSTPPFPSCMPRRPRLPAPYRPVWPHAQPFKPCCSCRCSPYALPSSHRLPHSPSAPGSPTPGNAAASSAATITTPPHRYVSLPRPHTLPPPTSCCAERTSLTPTPTSTPHTSLALSIGL